MWKYARLTEDAGEMWKELNMVFTDTLSKERADGVQEEREEWFENVIKDYDRLLQYAKYPQMLVMELKRYREAMSEQYNEEKDSLPTDSTEGITNTLK